MRTMRGPAAMMLLCVLFIGAAFTWSADPAAVLIKTAGKLELQRAGRTLPATVGTAIEAGDRLVIPAGGSGVLMYRTGKIETVTATVVVQARQSEQVGNIYRQTVQTIVQVATTDAGRQPNRQGMIRPVAGEATPVSPRNEIRVLDVRPTFTWMSVADAPSYTVQLRRTDVAGARPVRLEAGGDTVWTYPATEPPLVPGATYQWTVAAAGGRVAAAQTFRVIDSDAYANLSTMLDELAAAGGDDTNALFLTALWYRDAGLYYEADRALSRLADAGDGSGKTYFLLRGDVLDRLGALEAAAAAFQAADREPSE